MISVDDDEARRLDAATGVEYDSRVAGVLLGDANEYGSLLALQVRAQHTDEPMGQSFREAEDAYERLRRHAGIDREAQTRGSTTVVHLRWLPVFSQAELAALPPPPATRRPASLPHEYLLVKARNLHALGKSGQGHYDAATVVAHAACEVAITAAMKRLITARSPGLEDALEGLIGNSRYSLRDPRVAALWDALAEDELRRASFWERYAAHYGRRNSIVHAGISVSRDQATASIEAAQEMCDHVTERSA